MAKHNEAYTLDTLTVPGTVVDAQVSDMEPAENIRYTNFFHTNSDGVRFKLGYLNKRGNIVSPSMTTSHVNQAGIIARLDEDESKITSFLAKVVVGTYNPGKGDAEGSHFINTCALSKGKHVHQYGYARLEEDNADHADMIAALKKAYSDTPKGKAAANAVATKILKACEITYSSAVPKIHEYDF